MYYIILAIHVMWHKLVSLRKQMQMQMQKKTIRHHVRIITSFHQLLSFTLVPLFIRRSTKSKIKNSCLINDEQCDIRFYSTLIYNQYTLLSLYIPLLPWYLHVDNLDYTLFIIIITPISSQTHTHWLIIFHRRLLLLPCLCLLFYFSHCLPPRFPLSFFSFCFCV